MPMSASGMKSSEKAKILTKLQSLFPAPAGLLAAELSAYNTAQTDISDAISEGALETVPHIVSNTVVTVASTGATLAHGAGAPAAITALPGTGTVA